MTSRRPVLQWSRGVQATEVGEHQGMRTFAFADPELRWFAVAE